MQFKDLMLSIDPADEDDEDDPRSAAASGRGTPAGGNPAPQDGAAPPATTEDGQPAPQTNGETVPANAPKASLWTFL